MSANPSLSPLLLFVSILQIGHRGRFRSLVAENRIDQRMHHVLNKAVDRADLRHHERSVFGLHPEYDAYLELHREAVLGDDFKRIEGVGDLSGGPFNGLDRKSTRLNSSHVSSSYAVFCLKTKSARAPPLSIL